jgi:hypothetical protein
MRRLKENGIDTEHFIEQAARAWTRPRRRQ